MSFGAVLYSPAEIEWQEFVAFMADLQPVLGITTTPQEAACQTIHDVVVEQGSKAVFLSFKRADWGADYLFERSVQTTGQTQQVAISIDDMREYDLVMSIIAAFAQRWPCELDYLIPGKPPVPREDILRTWTHTPNLP